MKRRDFLTKGAAVPMMGLPLEALVEASNEESKIELPPLAFEDLASGLKITEVNMVSPKRTKPWPEYEPAKGSWSTGGVEVANPMSIYPKYKATRSLFMSGAMGPTAVQIITDKGVSGIGYGGPGASFVIEKHLTKLLLEEDPFQVERLWDIMWRSTLYYGRKGMVVHAISAVDNALWDIIGKALNTPVYQLLGGKTKDRIPAYCTGNDLEQHVEFGYTKLKLAIPYGPADGREGLKKNVQLVERARDLLGPDGEIMLDCWMAFTEDYTIQFAEAIEPYRVYWMEECLPPDNYAGFGRLNERITSTRIVTGEHEYTRYGFQLLQYFNAAKIWQPDMNWCGGLTELRRIGAMAAAEDIPVILHGGWRGGGPQYIMATPNSPWCEMFMPAPGGPKKVYEMYEAENKITRGPEGIYMEPSDRPGFGWELEV
ncbi:MAG: L-rhamnonate dehydratase [Saprospiraceae bacterium]|nr:L-rhamnonate dehydratase [Saprospiraceae bacterium]